VIACKAPELALKAVSSKLAASREPLVASHLSFPCVCHVAVAGDVFRWVPAVWDY